MAEEKNRNEDWETSFDNLDALPEGAIEGLVLGMELIKRRAQREAKTATIH